MADNPDWKNYELEIVEQFRYLYPSARISANVRLPGKFSKTDRQIDILVEEEASDLTFRIVIDAKHRGRRIDVGDVEAFLGFVRDVQAHTGILVALEGYTPAAINRVHYDDPDVILDVLNLDELKKFQGLAAIPYAGKHGASMGAPFGWIVDATQRGDALAWLYQRGLGFEEALKTHEFMYVNFWNKEDKEIATLQALVQDQENYLRKRFPDAEIEYLANADNQRVGAKTLIRRMKTESYPALEYTGFIDFAGFIFMCVLFTPEQLGRKNLQKLRYILRDAFPMSVVQPNAAKTANLLSG